MLNEFSFIGNLTKKPELRKVQTKNGTEAFVTTLTVAIDRRKSNIPAEGTDFFDITVWGRTAENCSNYLNKGSRVYVKGYIVINTSEKDGQRRFFTQFTGQRVVFLSRASEGNSGSVSNTNTTNSISNTNTSNSVSTIDTTNNTPNINLNSSLSNINTSPDFNIGSAFIPIDGDDIPF